MYDFSKRALESVAFAKYIAKKRDDKVRSTDLFVGILYAQKLNKEDMMGTKVTYEDAIRFFGLDDKLCVMGSIKELDFESISDIELDEKVTKIVHHALLIMENAKERVTSESHLLLSMARLDNGDLKRFFQVHGISLFDVMAAANSSETTGNMETLEEYCIDMTKEVYDPMIGREDELGRVFEILGRRTKNNPIIVGEAGIGKTAIVEAIASKIQLGTCPDFLLGKRIFSLNVFDILAGAKERGEMESRIKKILKEVEESQAILFMDEIHTLVGAGSSKESKLGIAQILKPLLTKGSITVIGATTYDEYIKNFDQDKALQRRFQPVFCEAPSSKETLDILKGLKLVYENYHNCIFPESVVQHIVSATDRFIKYRNFPDKAIDVIDEVGSIISSRDPVYPDEFKSDLIKINSMEDTIVTLATEEKYEDANAMLQKMLLFRKHVEHNERNETCIAKKSDVDRVVSNWSGVPIDVMNDIYDSSARNLEEKLRGKVIGQDKAVKVISGAMRRNDTCIRDPSRPLGSFLFVGPTGCGKSFLAKVLSDEIFKKPIVQIDMSEYMEPHAVSRLIGAPPGYIGHDESGLLTRVMKRNPYCVLLFDEIEKAHPDVSNILLQILDDGHITDAQKNKIDFTNCVIILTSNLVSTSTSRSIGFDTGDTDIDFTSASFDRVKEYFRPEFLNRLDDIVFFSSLKDEDHVEILKRMIFEIDERLPETCIAVEDTVMQIILKQVDAGYGARSIRRLVTEYIENPIAEYILSNDVNEHLEVQLEEGNIIVTAR